MLIKIKAKTDMVVNERDITSVKDIRMCMKTAEK
jgi:hypothetical protein